jgi:hypothetical protein
VILSSRSVRLIKCKLDGGLTMDNSSFLNRRHNTEETADTVKKFRSKLHSRILSATDAEILTSSLEDQFLNNTKVEVVSFAYSSAALTPDTVLFSVLVVYREDQSTTLGNSAVFK